MTALRLVDGMRRQEIGVLRGELCEGLVVTMQHLELLFRESLDIDQAIAGSLERRNDLAELQLNRPGFPGRSFS